MWCQSNFIWRHQIFSFQHENFWKFKIFFQHQLASLLKTAENLKIKGLAEVSSKGEGENDDSNRSSPSAANGDHNGSSTSLIPTTPKVTNAIPSSSSTTLSSVMSSGSGAGSSAPPSPKKPKVSIEPAGSSPMTPQTPKEPRLTLLPQSQLKEPDRGSSSLNPLIMKRKRGRPRILDAPGEVNPFAQTRLPEVRTPYSLVIITVIEIIALDIFAGKI